MRSLLLAVTLVAMAVPAVAQETIFPPFPQWTSSPLVTKDVQLVDLDNNGRLDLVQIEPSVITFYPGGDDLFPLTGKTLDPSEGATYPAFGDIDGDGDPDLVAVGSDGVVLVYGNDNGLFRLSEQTTFPAERVALADADRDGDLDLFRFAQSEWALHLNRGGIVASGVFEPTPVWSHLAFGFSVLAFAFGDLNGDERVDLVVVINTGHVPVTLDPVTVFVNTGGSFQEMPFESPDAWIDDVALGDIDGDRDLDIVTTRYLLRNQNGTIDPTPETISTDASCVGLGDVDADGDLDLVLGRPSGGAQVRLGAGGTFQPSPAWTGASDSTTSLALGDVDGDGALDLMIGNNGERSPLFLNRAPFLAIAPVWEASKYFTQALELADLDGDQDLDVIRGVNYGIFSGLTDSVIVYTNVSGSLSPTSFLSVGSISNISLGDVDKDGDPDLAVAGGYNAAVYRNEHGAFEPTSVWVGNNAIDVAFADFDSDGDLDLVTVSDSAFVYTNKDGTLDAIPSWRASEYGTTVDTGDIDGNGFPDVVVGSPFEPAGSRWFRNWADGLDTTAVTISTGTDVKKLFLAALNTDTELDLLEVNGQLGPTFYRGQNGSIFPAPDFIAPNRYQTDDGDLADLDGDGDLDLLASGFSAGLGGVDIYLNSGASFSQLSNWTNPGAFYGQSALGDVDGDGDIDAFVSEVDAQTDGEPAFLRLYPNRTGWKMNPDSALVPAGLPDNAGHLRWVRTDAAGENRVRISITAVDAESDPLWISGEYRFQNGGRWSHMDFANGINRFGPLATSPSGVAHEIEWDIERVPFSRGDAVIRLWAISPPRRGTPVQYQPAYLHDIGPISPHRPALGVFPFSVDFGTVTLGDTIRSFVQLTNVGTSQLTFEEMTSEDPSLILPDIAGAQLAPGERRLIAIQYAPTAIGLSGVVNVTTNDPVTPVNRIPTSAQVIPIEFQTRLIATQDEVPLGEAVTIIVTPAPDVSLDGGTVFYRAGGDTSLFKRADLAPQGATLAAVIIGSDVTESGIEFYAEATNGEFSALDPKGAPDDFFFQAVSPPIGFTALAVGDDFPVGDSIRVVAELPSGSEFRSGSLYFRPGGSSQMDSVAVQVPEVSIGERDPYGTIPASAVGPRGVEFQMRVVTSTQTLFDPPVQIGIPWRALQIDVANIAEEQDAPADRYRMVAVPLELNLAQDGTLEGLLADQPEFGPYDPLRWRSFRYRPSDATYAEISDDNLLPGELRPEPGRAFWLISRAAGRIETSPVPGRSTRTGDPFAITLEPGWNQVGTPFLFAVPWDMVERSEAIGDPVRFDPTIGTAGDYAPGTVTVLMPYEGYFIENTAELPEQIFVRPIETILVIPAAEARETASPQDGWSARLIARTESSADGANRFGAWALAQNGYDALDRRKPPQAPGADVRIAFANREWSERPGLYREDMRAPAEGHAWEIEVQCTSAGEAVTISLSEMMGVPEGTIFRVVDRELGTAADFSAEEAGYRLLSRAANSPYRLTLLAGSRDWVERAQKEQLDLPRAIALDPAAPNPMRAATSLRFALPGEAQVSLEIFDVSGQRVAALLENERVPAGRHAYVWDGTGRNGDILGSGVYFYRLRVGETQFTRRLVLVR